MFELSETIWVFFMSLSHSSKRILVVGREVGPIIQLLKQKIPEVSIGAVDLLGNEETRFYADWKFSVEKQTTNMSIFRSKHRTILDLLYELTRVMLEDFEFDLLIPLTPFQTKPEYLHQLSQEVQVLVSNNRTLEQVVSPYSFLTMISTNFPGKLPSPVSFSILSEVPSAKFPLAFVSDDKIYFFSTKASLTSKRISRETGFLFPFSQVHCGFFISSRSSLSFLGLQTLQPPYNHKIFPNNLEKNALLPFSLPPSFSQEVIVSFLSKIITQLNLIGIITMYFVISKDRIFPISCSALPDENFDLWESRSSQSLIQFLLSAKHKKKHIIISSNFAFKLPIYSPRPISVPSFPKTLASQRNLPRVISHPEYPLCTISGTSSSSSSTHRLLQQKKREILKILHSNS